MTLSREGRLNNIDLALRRIMELLGDGSTNLIFFKVPSDDFSDIYATTWADLENKYWIRENGSTPRYTIYRLTGWGWIEGLKRTAQLESAFEKLVSLRKAAKARVKGREDDASAFLDELSAEASLPKDFVDNVVDSDLLSERFPDELFVLTQEEFYTYLDSY